MRKPPLEEVRPFASKRPIGPLAQLNVNRDDLVVRFAFFERTNQSRIGNSFDFSEEDPDGIFEEEIRDAIRTQFTETELEFIGIEENELVYRVNPAPESSTFGEGVVVWNGDSMMDDIYNDIDSLPRTSGMPELETVTVSKMR